MTTKCSDMVNEWWPSASDRPLIERLAQEIDILNDKLEALKGPTYGPMIEDKE